MKNQAPFTVLAVAVLALAGVLGTASFVLGFGFGDSPCILCWAQRLGMALVALIGIFILRYGPKPRYVGLGILLGAYGLYMAVRHSGLHLARDVGQGFSVELLGAHTYIWSAFIYWIGVVVMGVLLLLFGEGPLEGGTREPGKLGRAAMAIFLVTIAGNVVQAFVTAGPPPYVGGGDPVRFSFNPSHWAWTFEEYEGPGPGWRGRWAIDKPRLAGLPSDPQQGPLAALPGLAIRRRMPIGVALRGEVSALAAAPDGERFLLTTDAHAVGIVDPTFTRLERSTVVDPAYSVDLGRGFVGAAWLDAQTVMAIAENKSFVLLQTDDHADAASNFRYFLVPTTQWRELQLGRFSTVRARMMYVRSLAYDAGSDSLLTVAVPNRQTPKLVVSRFERGDLTLSEEFEPGLAPGAGLKLATPGRSLGEYYVSGAAVADGRLYALSAAYDTLLVIDLAARQVVGAYAIPGLEQPRGLALRDGEMFVAEAGGRLAVVERPALAPR